MPNILALECASDTCSVALLSNSILLERISDSSKRHNDLILKMIDDLLSEAQLSIHDIDVYTFGCGPGSFTGIRIAASVIQGLAFANNKPVIPVSSLAALAQATYKKTGCRDVITAVDARMGEIYWAHYKLGEKDSMEIVGRELLCNPTDIPRVSIEGNDKEAQLFLVGGGCLYQKEISAVNPFISNWLSEIAATAKEIIQLALVSYEKGEMCPAEEAIPVYLRESVNWQKLPGR